VAFAKDIESLLTGFNSFKVLEFPLWRKAVRAKLPVVRALRWRKVDLKSEALAIRRIEAIFLPRRKCDRPIYLALSSLQDWSLRVQLQ
jgi:hypothetical protein